MADRQENSQHFDLSGGEAALTELYDRYGKTLYRAAYRILGTQVDAEEAVQETFLALVRSRPSLQRVADVQAYLFTVLRRSAFRLEAKRRRLPLASADLEEAPSRGDADTRTMSSDLESAVQQLPIEQRAVIALKIDGQLTFAEIGRTLGISANTAGSRYRYALEKLRSILQLRAEG